MLEECWNLQVVVDGGGSATFFKPININSLTYAIGKSVSSEDMSNILNQLSEHEFS